MTANDLETLTLGPEDALFLDFDGTLVELAPDPDAIHLAPETGRALNRIAERLGGALVLISGRDLRDLAARTPAGIWRAGGHGIEILPPGEAPASALPPPPAAVLDPLKSAAVPGVRIEIKGPVVAVHYRAAPSARDTLLEAAETAAQAVPGHIVQQGHMVIEVKPAEANKGAALRRLLAQEPFRGRRPVMLGDDRTDEDAIRVAQELGGIGIKIGTGETAARLRTPDPTAVRAWLRREAGD